LPLFYQKNINTTTSFAVWQIDETVPELLSLLENKEEYAHVYSLGKEHRQKEWLAVRVLLYNILGEHKSVDYAPSGKPFLADNSFFISFSHTKKFAAVCISTEGEIGIDVEYRSDRVNRVVERFLSPTEIEYAGNSNLYFLVAWCAKETAYKKLGEEGLDFAKHFFMEKIEVQQCGRFYLQEFFTSLKNKYLLHYFVEDDFVVVVG